MPTDPQSCYSPIHSLPMPLRLYNTLTHALEEFIPLIPGRVTFYTCGPTVYDFAHIGNFRSFLMADVLRRTLEYTGLTVRHVMNITDVGHMSDDDSPDGSGDDKMEVARKRLLEQKKAGTLPHGVSLDPGSPNAIADYYADAFIQDAACLGIKVVLESRHHPELLPRPTRYIPQMIAFVEKLIARGCAYVAADGVVYFDVRSFPDYGRLSGNTIEQIRSGAGGRVAESTQALKRHPADFMLWKPDPKHLMRWNSPWGEGYPGWHLECSVMAGSLLAADRADGMIDLHTGGEDNIFPHHECEIAQSCCAFGSSHFARYWVHARHLFVEGEKMSKSKGNFFTLRDLLDKGFGPDAIRFELIRTHYRTNANFTMQGLRDSAKMIERWREFVSAAEASPATSGLNDARAAVEAEFRSALESDLNVAGAVGAVNKWISKTLTPTGEDAALMRRFDSVLGVLGLAAAAPGSGVGLDVGRIDALIEQRLAARKNKDFARADTIRRELFDMGVDIKDGPAGTTWARRM